MEITIYEVLSSVIIIVSLISFHYRFVILRKKCSIFVFSDIAFAVVSLYWVGVYSYVLLANLGVFVPYDPVYFGRIFIRPMLLFTFTTIAVDSIIQARVRCK